MSAGWHATYNDFGATWGKAVGAVGLAIYQSLASRAWDGQCFPSYQTIAEDTGVSRPTAIKYIKKLQKAGLIEVQPRFNKRGDPSSNLYTLFNLPTVKKKAETQAKIAPPPALPVDTSHLSEEEIAEIARKSLFVPRPKKKPAAPPSTAESTAIEPKTAATTESTVIESAMIEQPVEPPVQLVQAQTAITVTPSRPLATQTSAPKAPVSSQKPLDFGLLTDEKDQINARHIMRDIDNKQEVLDELNKAMREGRIQTTAMQYLYGLVKKVRNGEFVPSAHKESEERQLKEEKQRAEEKKQIEKQAIANCKLCDERGHLTITMITGTGTHTKICTHDEAAQQHVNAMKARETKGELVTYFGKKPPPKQHNTPEDFQKMQEELREMAQQRRQAEKEHAERMSALEKQPLTAALGEPPTNDFAELAIPIFVTPQQEREMRARRAAAKKAAELKNKSGEVAKGGFRTLSDVLKTAMEQRNIDTSKLDEFTAQQELEPEPQPTAADPLVAFRTRLTPAPPTIKQEDIPVFSEEETKELTAKYTEYTEEERTRALAELPEITEEIVGADGKKISIVAQKIAAIRKRLDELYARDALLIDNKLMHHLRLMCHVKVIRARNFIRDEPWADDDLRKQVLGFVELVNLAGATVQTTRRLRKNLFLLDELIYIFDRKLVNSPHVLLELQRELILVRKLVVEQEESELEWQKHAGIPDSHLYKVSTSCLKSLRRERTRAIVTDEHPELLHNLTELNRYLPEEYQFTEREIERRREGREYIQGMNRQRLEELQKQSAG